MNPEAKDQSWISGKWPIRILLASVVVLIAAYGLKISTREVPFIVTRIEASNSHEFVTWFNAQKLRCTTEEAEEFSKAIGIIYADIGAKNPSLRNVAEASRAALCKQIDGQVVGDVVIRSYKLADEQLLRFISRHQNDIMKIIGAIGVNDMVKEKQEVVAKAQAQIAKNKQRIAAIEMASKQ